MPNPPNNGIPFAVLEVWAFPHRKAKDWKMPNKKLACWTLWTYDKKQ
jgi:hypothetical protein